MAKFTLLLLLSLTLALVFSPSVFAEEAVTITTYYPSPYGVYNQLEVTRSVTFNSQGNLGNVVALADPKIGELVYSQNADKFYYNNGSGGATNGWVPLTGGGGLKTFCGATTNSYNGNLGGYSGANQICNAQYPGARMCMTADFVNGIPTTDGWYSSFLSSHTSAYLLDCLGWTSNAYSISGFRLAGPYWSIANPGPWENNCDSVVGGPILCCR